MRDYEHTVGDQTLDIFGPLTPPAPRLFPVKPPTPSEGCVLVEKVGAKFIRITRPDGSFKSCLWVPDYKFDLLLLEMGIPKSKWEKLLNHVWSYRFAYASITEDREPYDLDDRIDNAGVTF